MANSVDPDQMPHYAASDLGLHCFQRPICPNTKGYYGTYRTPSPHYAASDLGLHCFQRPICPNAKGYYGTYRTPSPHLCCI